MFRHGNKYREIEEGKTLTYGNTMELEIYEVSFHKKINTGLYTILQETEEILQEFAGVAILCSGAIEGKTCKTSVLP